MKKLIKVTSLLILTLIPNLTEAFEPLQQRPDNHFLTGIQFGKKGEFEKAHEELIKAVNQKQYRPLSDEAIKIIEDYQDKKINHESSVKLFNLLENIVKEDFDEAKIEIEDSSSKLFNYPRYYLFAGYICLLNNEFDKAKNNLTKAINLNSDYSLAYLYRGLGNLRNELYMKAISDFTEAIRTDPDDELSYINRAFTYEKLGDDDKAIDDYSAYIKLRTLSINNQAYPNRGDIYLKKGMYKEALADYKMALSWLAPDSILYSFIIYGRDKPPVPNYKLMEQIPIQAQVHLFIAYYYRYLGQTGEAISQLEKVLQICPDNISAYKLMADVYYRNDEYNKALDLINKAIQIDPNNIIPYDTRAEIYKKQNFYDKALSDYKKVLELNPGDNWTLFIRALYFKKIGEIDKAILDYSSIVRYFPDDVSALYRRAEIYSNRREYDKALQDCFSILEIDKNQINVYFLSAIWVGPVLFIVIIEVRIDNLQNSGLRGPFLGIK